MRRAYKFRLRPTARQHVALGQCLDAHREIYNAALQERRDAWKRCRVSVNFAAQSAQLPEIRGLRPDIARWGAGSEQETLRRIDRAFAAFYRRCRAGQTPGYPRFKAAHRFDSVSWHKDGNACRWKPEHSQVYLQGIGTLRVTAHRTVEGVVKTIAVKREGRRWFLLLSCDAVPARPLPATGAAVGIDVGIAAFAATSDRDLIDNPRWGRVGADRLAAAQVVLARKKRGSANRRAASEVVANRHRKVANQRRDFHHQVARRLVDRYDVLAVEKLSIANMSRRPKPVPDPDLPGAYLPNGAAAKAGLNRSILDAGWGAFISILTDKAACAGRQVVAVNPRHTSQRCARCGHVDAGNRVTQAAFRCLACGHADHADVNAAQNILGAGLALLAASVA